ncbi:hypothetical protein PIB30_096132 [Stylosanthes scabra]|uniref:Uncharacterized protein n=1 Tax=Stylosanthes scabra TaxID=79078 RepID=A0ABU6TXD3_9FABA|nr:hypothetical protein [Stylosanthes scabra]
MGRGKRGRTTGTHANAGSSSGTLSSSLHKLVVDPSMKTTSQGSTSSQTDNEGIHVGTFSGEDHIEFFGLRPLFITCVTTLFRFFLNVLPNIWLASEEFIDDTQSGDALISEDMKLYLMRAYTKCYSSNGHHLVAFSVTMFCPSKSLELEADGLFFMDGDVARHDASYRLLEKLLTAKRKTICDYNYCHLVAARQELMELCRELDTPLCCGSSVRVGCGAFSSCISSLDSSLKSLPDDFAPHDGPNTLVQRLREVEQERDQLKEEHGNFQQSGASWASDLGQRRIREIGFWVGVSNFERVCCLPKLGRKMVYTFKGTKRRCKSPKLKKSCPKGGQLHRRGGERSQNENDEESNARTSPKYCKSILLPPSGRNKFPSILSSYNSYFAMHIGSNDTFPIGNPSTLAPVNEVISILLAKSQE